MQCTLPILQFSEAALLSVYIQPIANGHGHHNTDDACMILAKTQTTSRKPCC